MVFSLDRSRRNLLGYAIGDNTVLDTSFDQPVVLVLTSDSVLNTFETQIVITILTDTAVVMFIGNRPTAMVAVNTIDLRRGLVRDNGGFQTVLA